MSNPSNPRGGASLRNASLLLSAAPRVALAMLTGMAPALVPIAGHAQPADQQSLNVQNADIRAFIQDVSRATGYTFVIDPRVSGTVSIASGTPLNDDQIFEVFLATLRAHGYVVIPTATGAYRIAPDSEGATQPSSRFGERFTTQVIRVKSRDPEDLLNTLKPFVGKGGQIAAAKRSNAIIVSDFADNVRRIQALIADLDKDTDVVDILSMTNTRASVIADALREITGGGDKSGSAVRFTPVEASNSLVLSGPSETIARLKDIAMRLDEQARPTGDTRVIFLQHVDASQMVELLQSVIGQPATAASRPASASGAASPDLAAQGAVAAALGGAGGASGSSGPQRGTIARFEGANALVVRADPSVQQEIESIVRQLDRRAEQVLVEAVVVEVSDTAAKELGVQFLLSGDDNTNLPFMATNYSNVAPNLLTLSAALAGSNNLPSDSTTLSSLQTAAVNSLLGAAGGIAGFASDFGGDALFGMIINAVKQDSDSNVLSTPSVLTLNNKEATFLAGQDVPITTGEALLSNTTNPFRTFQRQDVGIKLKVRPQINADGAITLFLRQEVSSVATGLSASLGELVFNKREIETTVLVDNGEIVVLGGLLDEGETISAERVPLLGDVPVVGNLFRSEARNKTKTNLMIFIRPTILRSAKDARLATDPALERMKLARPIAVPGQDMLDKVLSGPFAMPSRMEPAAPAAALAAPVAPAAAPASPASLAGPPKE